MIDTLHLILVDDNPDDRALVIRELRRACPALEVVEIIDNASFAKALAEGTYDLVITDYELHWTTGLGILQAVKKVDPTCPVIMFTGMGSAEIAVAAMKAGVDDYVLKSSQHVAHLPSAVHSALEMARHRRAVRAAAELNRAVSDVIPPREKWAMMGALLADISHELNNPLSIILGHAALLCQILADTPSAEQAEKIVQAAEKCARIMRDFLALVWQESPEPSAVQVKQVVRGARILVVDDEPGIAEVLAEVFQLDGHVVEMVGNGEAALEKLVAGRYDLILSDVRMPDLDGPALYREVERRRPDLLQRFIFLTGDIMSPETSQFLAQTAVPCLSKPFTLEMVREVVQRMLSEASRR
jgi:DNA-binding NtrC family response regulator